MSNIRTIRLVMKPEGDWHLFDDGNEAFASENDTIRLIFGYGKSYDGYRKRVDIFLTNDKSIDYIEADVNGEFEFYLTNEHLKQGLVKLQPIAWLVEENVSYLNSKKQKWKVYSLPVNNSLNVGESTVNVDKTLGEQLSEAIEDLEDEVTILDLEIDNKIDVDGLNSNIEHLTFDTTPTALPNQTGQLGWDSAEGTLDLIMNGGNVRQSIGLELYYRVKNASGSLLTDGTLVQAFGTDGNSGVINVKPYDGVSPRFAIMGIVTENIENGDLGFITWFGKIRGLDTRGGDENWQNGEILYPSLTVPGGLTKFAPVGFEEHPVAIVINRHQNVGTIFVRVI